MYIIDINNLASYLSTVDDDVTGGGRMTQTNTDQLARGVERSFRNHCQPLPSCTSGNDGTITADRSSGRPKTNTEPKRKSTAEKEVRVHERRVRMVGRENNDDGGRTKGRRGLCVRG